MVRVVHKEEISIDYVNTRDTSTNRLTDKDRKVHHAPAGKYFHFFIVTEKNIQNVRKKRTLPAL